jgi:hypothetical protein
MIYRYLNSMDINSGVGRLIIRGADIHIFVSAQRKNNGFQQKLLMPPRGVVRLLKLWGTMSIEDVIFLGGFWGVPPENFFDFWDL